MVTYRIYLRTNCRNPWCNSYCVLVCTFGAICLSQFFTQSKYLAPVVSFTHLISLLFFHPDKTTGLPVPEVCIQTVGLQQLFMCTLFHYFTFVENNNTVHSGDR